MCASNISQYTAYPVLRNTALDMTVVELYVAIYEVHSAPRQIVMICDLPYMSTNLILIVFLLGTKKLSDC